MLEQVLTEIHNWFRVWDAVNDISDSICKGYVTVYDLQNTLKDEAGIVFGEGK